MLRTKKAPSLQTGNYNGRDNSLSTPPGSSGVLTRSGDSRGDWSRRSNTPCLSFNAASRSAMIATQTSLSVYHLRQYSLHTLSASQRALQGIHTYFQDSCSSGQHFAFGFLQIPPRDGRTPKKGGPLVVVLLGFCKRGEKIAPLTLA